MSYYSISKREQEVLELIALEYNTSEIAQQLFVSPHTVISHRRSLKRKLRARNTAGMIYRAFEAGILSCTLMESAA